MAFYRQAVAITRCHFKELLRFFAAFLVAFLAAARFFGVLLLSRHPALAFDRCAARGVGQHSGLMAFTYNLSLRAFFEHVLCCLGLLQLLK
jgi:hypothetical protein